MGEHRIIVIEDQEDLAALYERTLTKQGYRVTKAYTGEEGLAEFQDGGADAILLDMTLPEMNGVQTLQEIRALNANVPVIVATGETSDEIRQNCERLGVQAYLTKPVDHTELSAVLRRTLADPKVNTEEYVVVTLRLHKNVVKRLTSLDENLERAVTQICEDRLN
ncbi:MAG: response regulator [Acidobacteria bacterium]|nr:response regulator [Acidobacteriota bacterium]